MTDLPASLPEIFFRALDAAGIDETAQVPADRAEAITLCFTAILELAVPQDIELFRRLVEEVRT